MPLICAVWINLVLSLSNSGFIIKSETPQVNPWDYMKLDIILAKELINFPVLLASYNSKKAWNNPLSELPI